MKVLKFGGTSVGDHNSLKYVLSIVQENLANNQKIMVVSSAMTTVTNKLVDAGRFAASGNANYLQLIDEIEEKHIVTIKHLIKESSQEAIISTIKGLIEELKNVLNGVFLLKELSLRSEDYVLSFGERLSCNMIAVYFQQNGINSQFVDARNLIKTNKNFGNAKVDFEITDRNLMEFARNLNFLPVITGYIASTVDNETTTLGRGGSDYTASIIGAGVNAEHIEIWTDVDGVMTADPRIVKRAFTVSNISYQEAMELSHFGAKIIYSPTLYPAFKKRIPLWVKNTFNSSHPGTLVGGSALNNTFDIKGTSSINQVSVLNIQGQSMVGLPGFLGRLFNAIAQKNINVILATQCSSEYSICVAVAANDGDKAANAVNQEFEHEINLGRVEKVFANTNYSVLSIIGEGMRKNSGLAGKFFQALGKNGINITAIAQGASELNISAVIKHDDLKKALNVTHAAFFETDINTLNLYVVGLGLIGGTLLKQIDEHATYLCEQKKLKINVIGIANSKKMLINDNTIDLKTWKDDLEYSESTADLDQFMNQMLMKKLPNSIFVDCTSNKDIVSYYFSILESGISVVTPNKIANSSSYADYQKLKRLTSIHHGKFLYETNVGAGLPVINTLQNLLNSGDRVIKVEGILSGTLSYIFNNFKGNAKFSDIVKIAKDKGFTEPDPRDDLNGTDVARKILILAREIGANLELENVQKEDILPESCKNAKTVDEFFIELEKNNHYFEEKKAQAEKEGKVLRFIASFENNTASIKLTAVDSSHPFYSLSGSDNIISFTTDRYRERPLVVQGPGAGAEVTASGLFAEIITLNSYLKS